LSSSKPPEFGPEPPSNHDIAACISLKPSDLEFDGFKPEAVSCGLPFLCIPIGSLAAIRRARVNLAVWEEKFAKYWAPLLYLFTKDTESPESSFHVRMFGPGAGLVEDPATGSAAAAFGAYLGLRDSRPNGVLEWTVEQGLELGRPSILKIETEKREGKITGVRVGGSSVLVSEGFMDIRTEGR
jgi:trans-2,3-dihydro-3-hydroxyanthranilate isomerase